MAIKKKAIPLSTFTAPSAPLLTEFINPPPSMGATDVYKRQSLKEGFKIKEVKTGVSDFENTEIVSGLSEGEEIFLVKPESERTNIFSG